MGLDTVELIMAFEEAFDIAIEDADAERLQTPGAVIALVLQRAKGWRREDVARRVREIVIEQLDCAERYREDARFIGELGIG